VVVAQARNKKSVAVNLKAPEGRRSCATSRRRPTSWWRIFARARWRNGGLGYDALSRTNPGLVMVRLSGFGQTGPYKDRPGFGAIGESMGRHALHHGLSRSCAGARGHLHRRLARGHVRRDRRSPRPSTIAPRRARGRWWDVALYEAEEVDDVDIDVGEPKESAGRSIIRALGFAACLHGRRRRSSSRSWSSLCRRSTSSP